MAGDEETEDGQDVFKTIISGQYGSAESSMGVDLYNSNIELNKSSANLQNSLAHLHNARRKMLDNYAILIGMFTFMSFVGLIPVVIWLFKWAL